MKSLKECLDERSLDSELAIHAVKEWLSEHRPETTSSELYLELKLASS